MADWFAKNALSTATKDSATLLANVQTVNKTAQTIKSTLLPMAVSKYALLQAKVQDAINAVNVVHPCSLPSYLRLLMIACERAQGT